MIQEEDFWNLIEQKLLERIMSFGKDNEFWRTFKKNFKKWK